MVSSQQNPIWRSPNGFSIQTNFYIWQTILCLGSSRLKHLYVLITSSSVPCSQIILLQELEQAREIFDRIPQRDLYKCVDYKVIDWPDSEIFTNHITPKKIVESALALISVPNTPDFIPDFGDLGLSTEENVGMLPTSDISNTRLLQESDVIVDFSTMHYGMKEKNPLDSVRFYSKLNMNRMCHWSFASKSLFILWNLLMFLLSNRQPEGNAWILFKSDASLFCRDPAEGVY